MTTDPTAQTTTNWCEFCRMDHGEVTHAELQRSIDKTYWPGATLWQIAHLLNTGQVWLDIHKT